MRHLERSLAARWTVTWAGAAALYLLLIDTTQLPELLVGAGVATVAAIGAGLARRQDQAGFVADPTWLTGIPRVVFSAPADIAVLMLVAVRQLVRPQTVVGEFRSIGFGCGDDPARETGRRALAESLGSFAPNTVIIGIDPERERLLTHQLCHRGGAETLDPLRLR